MGIGGALAAARTEAGLTVAQVSERTRIRETIIRGIEHDDYSACGGDYYARGHIRAIARVVGTDPVPLVEEYDAAHLPPPEPAGLTDDPDADAGTGVPGGITAAEAFRPRMPLEPRRGLSRMTVALGLTLLAAIGVLTYLLASGPSTPASSRAGHHSASQPAARQPSSAPGAATHPASAPSTVTLTPASAAAFGPGGVGHGDDPQQASLAIDGSDRTAWQTDWYATADFGGLQPGTGLLLNMGKRVSVTGARILLGAAPGGALELRAGNTPSLADLRVVARAHLAGGALTVPIASPVKARYLLIWFTQLPPDSSGTYRDSISSVSLSGTT